jgi:hypothetical protein
MSVDQWRYRYLVWFKIRAGSCSYRKTHPIPITILTVSVGTLSQFLERTSTIESPFYQYDPALEREIAIGVGNRGVTVMGVDILPTELPKDSSDHFGHVVEAAIVPEILGALSLTEQGVDPRQLSARLVGNYYLLSDVPMLGDLTCRVLSP